jgi:uncharacterized tellurite resistance protein B-like protein
MSNTGSRGGNNPNNLSNVQPESLLDQLKALKNQKPTKGGRNIDVQLATAIVLVEVASSDHMVDRFERSVIITGLKSIFKISDETASGLIAKARSALASMRSSSAEASLLKDHLDPATKRAVANTIDTLIKCNGVVDSMEVYLRHRFRMLLGLPEEPMPPRGGE